MTSPVSRFVTGADDWARNILLDSFDGWRAEQIVHGWGQVIGAAAELWELVPAPPAQSNRFFPAGQPFGVVGAATAQIIADASSWTRTAQDPRAYRIVELFGQATQAVAPPRPDGHAPDDDHALGAAELRAGLLHVCYVMTHAAVTSTSRQAASLARSDPELAADVSLLSTRIAGVEHVLDAQLHRRPHLEAPVGVDSLGQAFTRLARVAYAAQPAGIATNLVLADIGRSLTNNTARLAVLAGQRGEIAAVDVRDRMLPALQTAAASWEQARGIWARMLPPTDRPDPRVAGAGNHLQQLFQAGPGLIGHPALRTSLITALNVAGELAVLNRRALTNPDLTAPAGAVAKLTREAIDELPNPYSALLNWRSRNPAEGPGHTTLPEVLRTQFARQGTATLDAALTARSAGDALADHSGYHPLVALRQGQTSLTRRPRETPGIPGRSPRPPRIG